MLRRILAIIGIIILVGLYLTALISAILGYEGFGKLFMAAIIATVVVPVGIHLFLMINNVRQGRSIMDNPYRYRDKPEDEDGDKHSDI